MTVASLEMSDEPKILPEGVEIFQQSKCLDLAKCRQNEYLCNLISTVLKVDV